MGKLNVDVEQIMREIKEEANKIDDLEMIDFDDISVPKNVWKMPKINEMIHFKSDNFLYELENANKFAHVSFIPQVPKKNIFTAIIKKTVIKITRFYFKDIVERQNTYNANSVRSLNEIGNFICDMKIMADRQNEINEKLKMDIQEININFNRDYVKRLNAYERQNRFLKTELEKMKKQIDFLLESSS